jgi:hypothetical protein
MSIAHDLFFSDRLRDLERHDCGGQESYGLDDLLRSRVVQSTSEGCPCLFRSDGDEHESSAGEKSRHTSVNDREGEYQQFHRHIVTQTAAEWMSCALTGRRITGEPGQNAILDGRSPVHPRGGAALRAAQPADGNPPPRGRGREASATTFAFSGAVFLAASAARRR